MSSTRGRDVLEAAFMPWAQAQEDIIAELGRALRAERQGSSKNAPQSALAQTVQRAVQHYHDYYRLTEIQRNQNSVSWCPPVSALKAAFMWMGSLQRPSTAFQLLYTLMGHQIEAELEELLEMGNAEDGRPASLAALSASQLSELDSLQISTVKEEDRIEREWAKLQQNLADEPLLLCGGLTRDPVAVSARSAAGTSNQGSGSVQSSTCILRRKLIALQNLCEQADALQKSTLDQVLEVLHTPYQKGQYLLASAKLQVALRKLGHNKGPPSLRDP
ncbi:hypothetical protein L7F22_001608 [Adiantum nelumboides]|nr:hypothetical protein [Adiantum nelumboides]